MAFGAEVLYNNTSGDYNTAIGIGSLYDNTTGNNNTAVGSSALNNNTVGYSNSALGRHALYFNTTGDNNTAVGEAALYRNTTGGTNTALGDNSLYKNTSGSNNTAIGNKALYQSTTAYHNVAIGTGALGGTNITGMNYNTSNASTINNSNNTAIGNYALLSNDMGSDNTAVGFDALKQSDNDKNTAVGFRALTENTSGEYNVGIGANALNENTTGNFNTALGYWAQSNYMNTDLENTIAIGFNALCDASNQARIGNSSVTSIGGYANWSNVSDARFKTNIKENTPGLNFINKLRPVTYNMDMDAIARFKKTPNNLRDAEAEAKKAQILQTGFIAQEVEQTARELGFDFSGVDAPKNGNGSYGLRYATFVVPLVKGMQEQQAVIEQQEERIKILEEKLNRLLNE